MPFFEILFFFCFSFVCAVWLLIPKSEDKDLTLFEKSDKLYCDGDNT